MARKAAAKNKVEVISSKLSYEGPLFRVYTDEILENGRQVSRDVVRHNGSVVILAIDDTKSKRDPMIVMERQYRHAAKEYLLEVPAGRMEEERMRSPEPSASCWKKQASRRSVGEK